MKYAIALKADRYCKHCRGHGYVYESHGAPFGREPLVCECVFFSAPVDAASQAAIDRGDFEVISTEVKDIEDDETGDVD